MGRKVQGCDAQDVATVMVSEGPDTSRSLTGDLDFRLDLGLAPVGVVMDEGWRHRLFDHRQGITQGITINPRHIFANDPQKDRVQGGAEQEQDDQGASPVASAPERNSAIGSLPPRGHRGWLGFPRTGMSPLPTRISAAADRIRAAQPSQGLGRWDRPRQIGPERIDHHSGSHVN